MWGTKFTATTATKITIPRQVAPGVGVYYLGKDPKKRETFRKTKSKYGRSLASEKALVLAKKKDAERKKQLVKAPQEVLMRFSGLVFGFSSLSSTLVSLRFSVAGGCCAPCCVVSLYSDSRYMPLMELR